MYTKNKEASDYLTGDTIRVVRTLLGLTQTELGDLSGLTYASISRVETGTLKLSTESLARILTVFVSLGIERDELKQVAKLLTKKVDKE